MTLLRSLPLLFTLLLAACTGNHSEEAAPSAPAVSAADRLSQTTLTSTDYRAYLSARGYSELRHMLDQPAIQQELVLDYHSNRVLADHAEKLGLDQDPLTRERIAHARRQILTTALADHFKASMEYPDAEVLEQLAQEAYQRDQKAFAHDEGRRVAHILLKEKHDCPCEVRSLAERIDDIYARLENGEDFGVLAAEFSADRANAGNGGELSQLVKEDGPYVSKFTAAAFELTRVGDVSTPVQTRFGTHLIKLLEIIPPKTLSYEEVRESLIETTRKSLLESKLEKIRSEAYPALESLDLDALNRVIQDLLEKTQPDAISQPKPTTAPVPSTAVGDTRPENVSTDSKDESKTQ